jgi:hypothetical protein
MDQWKEIEKERKKGKKERKKEERKFSVVKERCVG